MGRWQPDSAARLAKAALELYAERGFDETTVAEIAERAGLTERTFFRHFADKREVLFSGAADLEGLMAGAVEAAPADATPMEALALGLEAAGSVFDDARRPFARRRQAVIDRNPQLYERELVKLSSLAGALAGALRARGMDDGAARLAADAGLAAFRLAFGRWVDGADGTDFGRCARDAVAELQAVAATG